MNTLAKKVPIPRSARIKPYYDTKQIKNGVAEINFFPPNATRKVSRDNYINNPFPGEEKRRIVGLSFELVKQFITDDAANNINSEAIINGIKDAGVVLTADNDYKEFLRTTIDRHSNFAGTDFEGAKASALIDAAVETVESKTAVLKSAGMYKLQDPFDVASNQSIDLKVSFADASNFPTDQNWNDSGQGLLFMRATLYLAEIKAQG
jgi:hypothetical protein